MSSDGTDIDDAKADALGKFLEELETTADVIGLVRQYSSDYPQWARDFAEEAALTRLLSASRDGFGLPNLERMPDFRIVRWLATGGMGIVYEAEQISLGRRVALKVRHGHPSPERQARFQSEQHALARLHQSHIVPIHVSGECDGWQYFAMAYIEGASLHVLIRTALRHVGNATAPLPALRELVADALDHASDRSHTSAVTQWTAGTLGRMLDPVQSHDATQPDRPVRLSMAYFRSAAQIVADAADALEFAHGANVIHRDIKPSNIMVDSSGHCWLIDFGLAQCSGAHESTGADADHAGTGQTRGPMGTPEYMAPEQHQLGEGSVPIGPRTDVWGLGATLYELLTLCRPFQGENYQEIRRKVLSEVPASIESLVRGVPIDLAAICRKALCKDAAGRYESAGALAVDLRRWLNGEPTTARPVRLARSVWMWARRNRGWAAALVAMLLACASAALFFILHTQAESRRADQRAFDAEERQRHEHRISELQRREVLINQAQRLQLGRADDGWSAKAWELLRQASDIQGDDRLRDLATATLPGLDARLVKRFGIPAASVAFAPDGRRLLIGGVDKTADAPAQRCRLWNSATDAEVASALAGEGPVAFDTAGNPRQLVLQASRNRLVVWDVAHDREVAAIPLPGDRPAAGASEPTLAMNAHATYVAASLGEQTSVWDIATGTVAASFAHPSDALAFSPKSEHLALVDAGRQRIVIWSLAQKKAIAEIPTPTVPTTSLAFGPTSRRPVDGDAQRRNEYLAVGDKGGMVTIWDLDSLLPIGFLRGSPRDILAIAFSPDGTLLASAGRMEARLWDVASGQSLLQLHDPHGMDYLTGLAFTPDGSRLAISSRGIFAAAAVTIWDLQHGRGMRRLPGLSGQIEEIVISPNGKRLAALAQNWEVGLWDLDTGSLRAIFAVPPGSYADNAALSFSKDGGRLAYSVSTRDEGAACVWDVDTCVVSRRWKLPPGLQNRIVFGDANQLWHFQVEIDNGKWLPDSSISWRTHPRIARIRDLHADNPLHPIAEVVDFNRHVYLALTASDSRYVVIEGRGTPEGNKRWIKVVDLTTGRAAWSCDVRLNSLSARFILDASGRSFCFLDDDPSPARRVAIPDGTPCESLEFMPQAISSGGAYFCLLHYQHKPGCYLFQDGRATPIVNLAADAEVATMTFDRASQRLALGAKDGSVVLCDFEEIRRRLNQMKLGW